MFVDWPQEKVASFAAKAGYAGVELAPFTLARVPDLPGAAERARVRAAYQDAGLKIVGLHWLLAKTEGMSIAGREAGPRERAARYLKDLIELCGELEGEVMVFGSPQQRNIEPDDEPKAAFDRAAAMFQELAPFAAAAEVTICFEPLTPKETNFINTMRQGVGLVEAVNHPNFRLHLDVKAMCGAENRPPADVILEEGGRYLRHFHANDTNLLGPGMGYVEQVPIGRALNGVGYNRWVSVETFAEGPGPEEIALRSIKELRRAYT